MTKLPNKLKIEINASNGLLYLDMWLSKLKLNDLRGSLYFKLMKYDGWTAKDIANVVGSNEYRVRILAKKSSNVDAVSLKYLLKHSLIIVGSKIKKPNFDDSKK